MNTSLQPEISGHKPAKCFISKYRRLLKTKGVISIIVEAPKSKLPSLKPPGATKKVWKDQEEKTQDEDGLIKHTVTWHNWRQSQKYTIHYG